MMSAERIRRFDPTMEGRRFDSGSKKCFTNVAVVPMLLGDRLRSSGKPL